MSCGEVSRTSIPKDCESGSVEDEWNVIWGNPQMN